MAVGDYLKPQRSPLSVYDEQMAQMLREQSAGIGAQQIAAEAYGGKFPVGTMTSKVLSGVLARANEKRALNRDAQGKRARSLLARITAGDLPENVSIDDKGNFFTTTQKEQIIEQPPEQLQQSTYGRGLEGQMAGVPDEVVRSEIREQGMNLRGNTEENPNLLERTFFGDVKGKTIENKYDLIEEAGYDTNQYLRQEKQDTLAEEDRILASNDRQREIKLENERIERDIEDRKISTQNTLLDIDKKKMDNKLQKERYNYEVAKSDNDTLSMKRASKKINDIQDIEELIGRKKFGDGPDGIYKKELFRANKLSSLGYGNDALAIYKNLQDVGFISTLSDKDKQDAFKDFNKIETSNISHITKSVELYKKLLKAAKEPGGVGKYTLMITYIKQLDDSVVREGEVRSFASMQGFIDNLEIQFKEFKGENFPDKIVHSMLDQAYGRVEGAINNYNNNKTDRIETYKDLKLDPKDMYSGLERLDMTGLVLPTLINDKMDFTQDFKQLPNIYSIRNVAKKEQKVVPYNELRNNNETNTMPNTQQNLNINRPPPNIAMPNTQQNIANTTPKPVRNQELVKYDGMMNMLYKKLENANPSDRNVIRNQIEAIKLEMERFGITYGR